MLALIVVVLLAAATGAVICNRNREQRLLRDRGWALFILIAGTLIIAAQMLRIPVPNPTDFIATILAPINKPIMGWLEEEKTQR